MRKSVAALASCYNSCLRKEKSFLISFTKTSYRLTWGCKPFRIVCLLYLWGHETLCYCVSVSDNIGKEIREAKE
jgi:hypothetical protein